MSVEVLANLGGRVAQCQRIENPVNDPQTMESLLRIARDIEADLQRLLGEVHDLDGAGVYGG